MPFFVPPSPRPWPSLRRPSQGDLVTVHLLATNGCVGVGVSEQKVVLPFWSALASGLGLALSVCRDYDAGVTGSSPHLSINEAPL